MAHGRTGLQQEVVEALVKSKAINMGALGEVFAQFSERAALAGDSFGFVVNRHVWDLCIPVDFKDLIQRADLGRVIGAANINRE